MQPQQQYGSAEQHQAPPQQQNTSVEQHQAPPQQQYGSAEQHQAPPPPQQQYGSAEQHQAPPPQQQQQIASAEQHQAPPPPQPQYGSAEQHQAPPQQYQAPPQQYQAPPQQYQVPPQQYQAPPPQYEAPPQQQQYVYAQGAPERRLCGTPAELLAFIMSIIVLLLSCSWSIYSSTGAYAYGSTASLSFIAATLVIIAYCLAHCGCNVQLIVLIWLYFVAFVINGISLLINTIIMIMGAVLISNANFMGLLTVFLVAWIIFFLLYLALLAFYEYVLWLAYNDIKRTKGFLPNYMSQTTGGSTDNAQVALVVHNPAPVVVVQAAPSSDGAPKPPPNTRSTETASK